MCTFVLTTIRNNSQVERLLMQWVQVSQSSLLPSIMLKNYRDPKSITNGIREIVENPEKRDSIEKLAYEYGQSMTWPSVALKYIDLFKELAQ